MACLRTRIGSFRCVIYCPLPSSSQALSPATSDGGAGARYQMRREVKSFWYPTWLAQPAALVEGSKLIDAPPHRLRFADVAPEAVERDLLVLHTSTPSFASDVRTVEALKERKPR